MIKKAQRDIDIKVATASIGQLLGFSDCFNKRPHTVSVNCISSSGTLYAIKVEEFEALMQRDKRTLKFIERMSQESDLDTKLKIFQTTMNMRHHQTSHKQANNTELSPRNQSSIEEDTSTGP